LGMILSRMTKVVTDKNKINEFLNSRYIEAVFPSKERVAEMMGRGKQLVFYWGIDPTGPDVHLGHTTNVFVMKRLAELGHKIIMLIGDFTATIGDPTDKEAMRKPLTEKEVKENMKTYIDQISKILPKNLFEVKYNSKWYNKLIYKDWLKVAMKFTQQQMIARDMFQERLKKDKPIGMHEFDYPMMQGYDSVVMNVDGEVGGNDQTFNMMIGRDLVKDFLGKEKIVIATRLLEDLATGSKIMNKSEEQYVAINQRPEDMFGKVMAMSDSAISPVLSYATEVTNERVAEVKSRLEGGENPMISKKELAYELVRMYHNEKEAQKARDNFERVFSEGQLPEEIQEVENKGTILQTTVVAGIASSLTEAKRLIDQGAIKINGETVTRWDQEVKRGDIIKGGPHKFRRVK